MIDRSSDNPTDPGNPVKNVVHVVQHGSNKCLGMAVHLWCPGCQALHMPRFRCPDHGGPDEGPIWNGDPHSEPFSMEPSLLVHATAVSPQCHSFIRQGRWEFLGDCTHALAGQTVPLEPLPNWIAR